MESIEIAGCQAVRWQQRGDGPPDDRRRVMTEERPGAGTPGSDDSGAVAAQHRIRRGDRPTGVRAVTATAVVVSQRHWSTPRRADVVLENVGRGEHPDDLRAVDDRQRAHA